MKTCHNVKCVLPIYFPQQHHMEILKDTNLSPGTKVSEGQNLWTCLKGCKKCWYSYAM